AARCHFRFRDVAIILAGRWNFVSIGFSNEEHAPPHSDCFFLGTISLVCGAIPALNVTVSDAGGKVAFKGATNSSGLFATTNLKPGSYIVAFNSTNAALKGNQYVLVISAGKKKVSANAVAGEKFTAGGVAMKIDVGASVNITGQVAAESKVAMKDGKKMV